MRQLQVPTFGHQPVQLAPQQAEPRLLHERHLAPPPPHRAEVEVGGDERLLPDAAPRRGRRPTGRGRATRPRSPAPARSRPGSRTRRSTRASARRSGRCRASRPGCPACARCCTRGTISTRAPSCTASVATAGCQASPQISTAAGPHGVSNARSASPGREVLALLPDVVGREVELAVHVPHAPPFEVRGAVVGVDAPRLREADHAAPSRRPPRRARSARRRPRPATRPRRHGRARSRSGSAPGRRRGPRRRHAPAP